jgi:hypothetical protein
MSGIVPLNIYGNHLRLSVHIHFECNRCAERECSWQKGRIKIGSDLLSMIYKAGMFEDAIAEHPNAPGVQCKTADFFYRSAENQQFGNMAEGLLFHEIGDGHHRG